MFNILIKNKFFNKAFLIYTTIVIIALLAFAYIISDTVTSSSLERDIRYNKLILYNINSILEQKEKVVMQLAKQAYSSTSLNRRVFEFLEYDFDPSKLEYFEMRKRFIEYLESTFASDHDLVAVTVYNKMDDTCYLVSKKLKKEYNKDLFYNQKIIEQFHDFSPKVVVYPAHLPSYSNNKYVYTMAMNIKSINTYNNIGTLIVDFDTSGITNSLIKQYEEIISDILILSNDGYVLYDSSNKYYMKSFPYLNFLKDNNSHVVLDGKECIISTFDNNNLGIKIIGILPINNALKRVKSTRNNILLVLFICVFATLTLTYLTTRLFSKRVESILVAIKRVRNGDLNSRIPLGKSKDELYEIALAFNEMCNDLQEYINRVYISEIQQKNAELMALQAQINPHFLYNTLESIRMKANTSGAKEVGKMIFILSKLFRNTVKKDSITDIANELENSKLYLELFKIRYGEKLSIIFDIDPAILKYGIPRHTIQPIIENYIVHGFDNSKADNIIIIKGHMSEKFIFIEVQDNGNGIDSGRLASIKEILFKSDTKYPTSIEDNCIGLANVNERIKIIFGKQCGLDIESKIGKGTVVKLKLLPKTVKELYADVQSFNCR